MTKIKLNDTTVEIPKDNSEELANLDSRVTTNENNIATNTQDIEDIKANTTLGMNALELVNGDDFDTLEFKSQPSNITLARLAFERENFDITGTSPEYEVNFIGSGGGGAGSAMYGGSFGFGNTNFTGADTVKLRSTGALTNIEGLSNIVSADPDNGVALFTNPTSKPITVVLNMSYSAGRSTGSADTLPKKLTVTPTNADIDGGIGDNAHITHGGGSILAMANVGYTNNQSLIPAVFVVPANGTFRLSFEIDGYGNLADTYTVSANATYVAFREDAKVVTEAINIPWSPLTGSTGGTAGEYKKIGSWTVVRWNITTGSSAGNYGIGTIPDVDSRPTVGFMAQVANQTGTGSQTFHLQINQKDGSGAGAITILNATASTNFRGQVVFNNDSAETVAVPYYADNDIILPDNKIVVGRTDGFQDQFVIDPNGEGVFLTNPSNNSRTLLAPDGFTVQDLDSSGNPIANYRWNTSRGMTLKNDVDWQSVPLTLPSTMSLGSTDTGFYIRNNDLFVNLNFIRTQNAITGNSTTLLATVPNVQLFGITRIDSAMLPGTGNRLEGYMEINSSGQIYYHNYDPIPAQSGTVYNQFRGYFKVPLKIV